MIDCRVGNVLKRFNAVSPAMMVSPDEKIAIGKSDVDIKPVSKNAEESNELNECCEQNQMTRKQLCCTEVAKRKQMNNKILIFQENIRLLISPIHSLFTRCTQYGNQEAR